jgi:GT2 family glycosyltransferase
VNTADFAPDQEARSSVTAPRVEVVMVARDPADGFEQTLTSLAGQDYPRYDVTVFLTASKDASDGGPRALISSILPDADIRELDAELGYAEAVNEVLDNSSPPAFYLFCHDDIGLSSDMLRLLVEEAIRSNASIAGPKIVDWERPDVLVDVGLDVDKLGHSVSRVEPGERDQEQHDAVVDVFAVSGAAQLVRGDLFQALDGFDAEMQTFGEDVDFCWRAHVAGARVMVVPSAEVRYRRALHERGGTAEVERLAERHRLRTLLTVYGIPHSLRVMPQAVLYSLIRVIGAVLGGQFAVARYTVGAWTWNLRRPGSLLQRRRRLRRSRKVSDGEIRPLQVSGFAPVSAYLRGQFGDDGRGSIGVRMRSLLRALKSGPSRVSLGFWAATALMLTFGSRHLVTRSVPAVGELVPFDLSPGELFGRFFDSWSTMGTGHEAAAPTAFGLTGFLGVVFLGAMGLLRTVMTVGMLPIGAIGMWRFLRPFSSPWIRVVGTLMYLVSPVPYNALASGSWSALLLFGTLPWVLAALGRAARVAPFGRLGGGVGEGVLEPSWLREVVALGLLLGVIGAFVPFVAISVLVLSAAILVGSVLAGWPGGSGRMLTVLGGAIVVAAALNLPWLVHNLLDTPAWDWIGGTRPATPETPPLSSVMRFDSGRMGGGFLGWALPVAGVTPLLLARGPRWAWAVRGSTMYLASVASVWALGNGWVSVSLPRPEVLYVVGALGLAVSAAMGVAAIERDLRTYKFGWRQLAPVTAVGAVLLALAPPTAATFDGAWHMPDQEFNELFAQQPSSTTTRVLWIGHDDVLATGGQRFTEGLTLAVSPDRVTGFADRWAGTPQPADRLIENAVTLALEGGTSRLGRLLAPFAIGEVILVGQSAPAPATGVVKPIPDSLVATLTEQLDLAQVEVSPGLIRYRNDAALAVAAVLDEGILSGDDLRSFASGREPFEAASLEPVAADRTSFTGPVTVGQEIYLAVPSDTDWRASVDGRGATERRAAGWAKAFSPSLSGTAVVTHRTATSHRLMMAAQAALWGLAIISLMRLNARSREQIR